MKGAKSNDEKGENNKGRERAEKLIDAIAGGNVSNKSHRRLRDWLLSIPENGTGEEALARWAAKNVRPKTSAPDKAEKDKFRVLAGILGFGELLRHNDNAGRKFVLGRRFAARAAAVLIPVMIAAAGTFFIFNKFDKQATAEDIVLYADNEGGNQKFTLPDGSDVTLEHGSKLVFSSAFASDRRMKLDGEALFEVARDTVNPFSVNNGGLNVVALGTKFKMKAHDSIHEAEVVLISGKVAVEIGGNRHHLAPNQRMVLDKSKLTVVEHSDVGPGVVMRITGGDLRIADTDAADALSIVADYFNKEIVMEEGLESDGGRLNIMLPHDEASIETAIATFNILSDNAAFNISGDTIYVSKK